MTSFKLTVSSVFVFLTICVGQAGGGEDSLMGLIRIGHVLHAAHVSGSLAYSSCGFQKRVPDAPPRMRVLPDYSGPAKEVLKRMFADDPGMQVTQEESGGMVRMMEANVPTDLLDFRIHHLSFFPWDASASDPVHGPQMAVLAILENAEVRGFKKVHNIGPFADLFPLPGNCCGGGLVIHGELDDVTVSQALDHVLQTFPGFWIYENCMSEEGERSVYINLFEPF